MEQEQGTVLSRSGNYAVVQLAGRAFPGLCVQGDTLAVLREQVTEAVQALRASADGTGPLDEWGAVVAQLDAMLDFYEQTLSRHGIRRPY